MIPFLIIVIVLIIILNKRKNLNISSSVVKSETQKALYLFLGIIGVMVLMSTVVPVIISKLTDNEPVVADGFTIEGYEVVLDVGVDNKVDVKDEGKKKKDTKESK